LVLAQRRGLLARKLIGPLLAIRLIIIAFYVLTVAVLKLLLHTVTILTFHIVQLGAFEIDELHVELDSFLLKALVFRIDQADLLAERPLVIFLGAGVFLALVVDFLSDCL